MGADKALLDTFEKLYSSRGANYAEALSKPLAKAAADIAVRREKLRKEIDDHVSLDNCNYVIKLTCFLMYRINL